MAISKYANSDTTLTRSGGGSSTATIGVGGTVTGSDVDCAYCRLQARTGNSGTTRVRIGATCTATTGVAIPAYPTLTPYQLDNLSKLYFYGTAADVIDIEYFT
jgi:hypothetical protein